MEEDLSQSPISSQSSSSQRTPRKKRTTKLKPLDPKQRLITDMFSISKTPLQQKLGQNSQNNWNSDSRSRSPLRKGSNDDTETETVDLCTPPRPSSQQSKNNSQEKQPPLLKKKNRTAVRLPVTINSFNNTGITQQLSAPSSSQCFSIPPQSSMIPSQSSAMTPESSVVRKQSLMIPTESPFKVPPPPTPQRRRVKKQIQEPVQVPYELIPLDLPGATSILPREEIPPPEDPIEISIPANTEGEGFMEAMLPHIPGAFHSVYSKEVDAVFKFVFVLHRNLIEDYMVQNGLTLPLQVHTSPVLATSELQR